MVDVRLEPMTEDEYKPWREAVEVQYAESIAASGRSAEDAARQSAEAYAQLLPDESATPGHHFWYAYDSDRQDGDRQESDRQDGDGRDGDGQEGDRQDRDDHRGGDRRVGFLWVKVTDNAAFIYNIAVEPDVRRSGYGRAIMLAAERWCRDNALTRIGLHVFAHNTGARALYEQLGFLETGRNLAKNL
ncbi:GNAT family N-acetyltransferase [Actinoplanes derwentensis]|uniref:Ribosomal protein S18 acetylase RimI n=1 Tax=Actinoplanes derwentensis TaxID=113562 RepID=A0A1H2DBG1_9ACTN|nr:GNAT family N-acetyltransferase [Actinoplanes derwentensis]SDT80078.1 Ribosomal protein S18 acetylase RimI [Actinoplanes derwentensis]